MNCASEMSEVSRDVTLSESEALSLPAVWSVCPSARIEFGQHLGTGSLHAYHGVEMRGLCSKDEDALQMCSLVVPLVSYSVNCGS